jgi:hypothetical protein
MPLNKFVPLSPDPYITSDPEMTLAKFGHLNTIVDYLNGTNALTNIKIAGINNTAGYIDFSANPTGSTTVVGAIRTYQDGTNLSEVLQFREDGTIFGSGSQTASNFVIQSDDDLTNLYLYSSACWGGLLTNTPLGNYNTILNGRIIGTHGGTGNSALALGTIQADTSGSNFSIAMGAGCTITNTQNGLAIGRNASITSAGESTAIGYQATTSTVNAIALGNSNALLQIGGNFVPTARVHVKGLGATSATTSLLVQNSGGTVTPLKTTDDGTAYIGWDSSGDFNSSFSSNGTINIGRYGNALAYYGNTTRLAGQTWKFTTSNMYWGSSPNESSINTDGTVSLGSYTAVPSAMLSMTSTTKGFLKPRLTTAQKNAIATPAAGLEIYDTDLNRPCFYSGSAWVTL